MTAPNDALTRWNALPAEEAASEILPCCGSLAWAKKLSAQRPFSTPESLLATSDAVWLTLPEADWQQAFDSHPRIGQRYAQAATPQSLSWSSGEQSAAIASQDEAAKRTLTEGNREYEAKFGRIFLICASGKSTTEILAILQTRMSNTREEELREAVEQQSQITQMRLRRWLGITE
jgi:2-oxo-4-hydroxy-4-carboxy-5-ureidoimidazoline decarboxylase